MTIFLQIPYLWPPQNQKSEVTWYFRERILLSGVANNIQFLEYIVNTFQVDSVQKSNVHNLKNTRNLVMTGNLEI